MIADILFLLFSLGLLMGAGAVVLGKNPMVGVLGMVFSFINAAGMFILLQSEFLGLLLIMVYVGAITVMFLFVLMTVDIDFAKLREGFAPYLPMGLLLVGALLAELAAAIFAAPLQGLGNPVSPATVGGLGQLMFTAYNIPFQVAGLVLLTAMIGAIVLTHRRRTDVKRQDIGTQVYRTVEDSMAIARPKVGAGASATHWVGKKAEK